MLSCWVQGSRPAGSADRRRSTPRRTGKAERIGALKILFQSGRLRIARRLERDRKASTHARLTGPSHRAIAISDLEAVIHALRLNRGKNLQDDVGFRKPRSSFRY
jgi:hypothetical protein